MPGRKRSYGGVDATSWNTVPGDKVVHDLSLAICRLAAGSTSIYAYK